MAPRILAVDDIAPNLRLLRAVLEPEGYELLLAETGAAALELAPQADLVLLDVHLPDMSGFEVCERIRSDPATTAIPVVMLTATAAQQRVQGIESGADDFLPKPFDKDELLARVRSLLRLKRYHDDLQAERARLSEQLVEQSAEIEHLNELRSFLPEPVLAAIEQDPVLLQPHRQEIAVLFADLRGFTGFSGSAEPEEVIQVLDGWHRLIGAEVASNGATVGYFAGDGVMLFWNDPVPCPDPPGVAVAAAERIVAGVDALNVSWRRLGYQLGVGIGVAQGFATVGMIGFHGRRDYTAIGPVVNLASRLSDEARDGRTILVNQRVHAGLEGRARLEEIEGGLQFKGFPGPMAAWQVHALDRVLG